MWKKCHPRRKNNILCFKIPYTDIKPEDTQLNLRRDQVLCKRLSIGAKYEEREVIAADHGVCPAVYLLSGKCISM